jgi:hypothetical protein
VTSGFVVPYEVQFVGVGVDVDVDVDADADVHQDSSLI